MDFREQLEALIDKRHVGASYAICATDDDAPKILRAELILHPRPMPPSWSATTRRHGLLVVRGWIDVTELRAALSESGSFVAGGISFSLVNKSGSPNWSWSQLDVGAYSTWTLSETSATGASIFEVLGNFDAFRFVQRRLPSFTPPFRNWAHLADYLQHRRAIESNDSSSITITAPTFALIENANLALDRELTVLVSSEEDVRDLALVVIADDDEWSSQTISGEKWTRDESYWCAKVNCRQLTGPGTIHLLFREETVHEIRFGISPLALRAHLALDPQLEWLQSLLGTGKKFTKLDGFEVGVASLMAFCGFEPVHYGHSSRDEFPDILCAVHDTVACRGVHSNTATFPEDCRPCCARRIDS